MRIAKQSVSSGKTAKPQNNAKRKQAVSGVQADINAFAFTTSEKYLAAFGLFQLRSVEREYFANFVDSRQTRAQRREKWVVGRLEVSGSCRNGDCTWA